MKKIFASALFVLVFAAYGAYQALGSTSADYVAAQTAPSQEVAVDTMPTTPAQEVAPAPTPPPAPKPAPAPTPTPAPKPKGLYADGSYTGSVADAYYGYVQVRATVSGGKLTDVQFLRYPNDQSTSRYINGQAMPILRSEAISAQSASVDGVSGASDTSAAFRQSLASALSQARS